MKLLDFLRSITATEDCIPWPGYLNPRGYGTLTYKGKPGRMAHRTSYEIHNGPIPIGMTVDHICFRPACVNPSHLQLLSSCDNAKRQRSSMRTHCRAGHEFTPDNTYIKPGFRNGRRTCRTCQRQAVARYTQRKKLA